MPPLARTPPKPEYARIAALIRAYIVRENISLTGLGIRLNSKNQGAGLTSPWARGISRPGPKYREKLAKLMGVKPAELLGLPTRSGGSGAPAGGAERQEVGPARRALIAHEKVILPDVRNTVPARHVASDVFAFRVRSDGTVAIALNVTLPLAKGVALAQSLMTMGVMMTPDPPQEESERSAGSGAPAGGAERHYEP
jgi:hypothetical protein